MSMKKRSGLSELSVISWVSAVEECPLSGRGSTVVILTILWLSQLQQNDFVSTHSKALLLPHWVLFLPH